MTDFSVDPLALTPEQLPAVLAQSFGAACGLTALLLALEHLPEDERLAVKERMLGAWKRMWVETFQRGMTEYNDVLSKVTNSVQLPQIEDYQLGFNRALAAAEKSARISLEMEVGS